LLLIAHRHANRLLLILIVLCATVFSYLSVVRHYTFNTAVYDLAIIDQAVWNTSQGRWFEVNLLEDTMPGLTNKLGDHVEPILLPLALLYLIRSSPDMLLIVQAIALATIIWPLYRLAQHRSRNRWLAGLAVVLYLLHPAMWNALLFDFHPVTLAAAFLVWALWLLEQEKYRTALICAVLTMMCKEQLGLSVTMLGVYAIFFHRDPIKNAAHQAVETQQPPASASRRRAGLHFFQPFARRFGLLLVVIGVGWTIIAMTIISPAFQPAGGLAHLERYGRLGNTLTEILLSPFTKPDVLWSMLSSSGRVAYYGDLLLPLGFLPLLGFELLLPALPDTVLNTLSAFAPSRTLDYHYAVLMLPFLILATIVGIDRLARWLGRKKFWLRQGLLIAASIFVLIAMAAYQFDRYHGFVPLSDRYIGSYTIKPRDPIGWQMAAQIPREAVVSGQFNLLSHVSQRQRAHIFPRIEDASYVWLDTQGVIEPFQTGEEYLAAVEALRNDPTFELISEQNGFLLFKRK
jgi:uncharacterized membrane protein